MDQIWRCFGNLISNLRIMPSKRDEILVKKFKHLIAYVAEYCAETSTEFRMTEIFFEDLMKLISQLTSLKMPFIPEADFFQTINECVPHLQHLSINDDADKDQLLALQFNLNT